MPPEMPDVVTGNTIASQWGNLIRSRTVQRYASAAQRTTEHPTPAQGDLSFLEDTGDTDVYGPSGWQHIGAPVASVKMSAGGSVPSGWLLCNGQAVSRTTFALLFAAIGTAWGVGNGSTTFNVPDLRGRVPRGVAASGDGDAIGDTFGSDTHAHSNPNTNNSASHTHTGTTGIESASSNRSIGDPDALTAGVNHTHAFTTGSGGVHAHSQGNTGSQTTIQASAALNFIIKT